ncbi:MAG: hypothetical protein RL701_4176 [Pseudomonadota bacterium]|jgi:hypothetical protein
MGALPDASRLFNVSVTCEGSVLTSLGCAVLSTDATAVQEQLARKVPRKTVACFLFLIVLVLAVSELGQIIGALRAGSVPPLIAKSQGAGNFVYVLDLAVVAPLCIVAARGLPGANAWADVPRPKIGDSVSDIDLLGAS